MMHVRPYRSVLAVAAALAALAAPSLLGCSGLTEPPTPEPVVSAAPSAAPPPSVTAAAPAPSASAAPAPSGPAAPEEKLSITTLTPGKGPGAKAGDSLRVHYVGTLTDGKKFDSSRDRGKPLDVQLGQGRVIKGWDQGLVGMKAGEKRKLVIPPSLAYGAMARPGIPANSTLVFEVELVAINPTK